MATIFGPDTFTVSSNINIDAYPSGDPDYAYSRGSGSDGTIDATDDRAENVAGSYTNVIARVIDTSVSSSMVNGEVRATLNAVDTTAISGLALRYSSSTIGYKAQINLNDTNETAIEEDNGGFTTLASVDNSLAANTNYSSSFRAVGGTSGTLLTFITGSSKALTYVDTTAIASGAPGFALSSATTATATVDNFLVDDLSGYPLVGGVASTNGSTATTSPVVNLPSGCQSGETLLMLIRNALGGTITYPSGWNELFEDTADASADTTGLAWKKATGSEGATLTMTSAFSTSAKFAAIVYRVLNAADPTVRAPEFSTIVTGTSTTPNPGAITPTGGSKKYLFFWMGGWEGVQTSPPASFPTNYNSPVGADSGSASTTISNCRVACAYREAEASSEDPGSWTISASDDWTATAVVVHPASVSGDITVASTGAAANVAAGTEVATREMTATGAAVNAAAGTPGVTRTPATLAGATVNVSAGTAVAAREQTATGATVNASAGTPVAFWTQAGLGVNATTTAGTLSIQTAITLSGATVNASAGNVGAAGDATRTATGAAVNAAASATLVGQSSLSLTGTTVNAAVGFLVAESAQAALLTGATANAVAGNVVAGAPDALTALLSGATVNVSVEVLLAQNSVGALNWTAANARAGHVLFQLLTVQEGGERHGGVRPVLDTWRKRRLRDLRSIGTK